LLEVIFAIVLLGVLVRVSMMKLIAPGTLTLHAQAQSLADTVRRGQSLATVRGQRMRVSVASSGVNGSVAVACASSAPCSTDSSFTASQDVVVGNSGPVYFNTLGQPVDSAGTPRTTDATFTLSYTTGSTTAMFTVTVAAITGRVSLSP
jgi:hypothetical protein